MRGRDLQCLESGKSFQRTKVLHERIVEIQPPQRRHPGTGINDLYMYVGKQQLLQIGKYPKRRDVVDIRRDEIELSQFLHTVKSFQRLELAVPQAEFFHARESFQFGDRSDIAPVGCQLLKFLKTGQKGKRIIRCVSDLKLSQFSKAAYRRQVTDLCTRQVQADQCFHGFQVFEVLHFCSIQGKTFEFREIPEHSEVLEQALHMQHLELMKMGKGHQ